MELPGQHAKQDTIVDLLLERAGQQGYLTSEDLRWAEEGEGENPIPITRLIDALHIYGIEIIESDDRGNSTGFSAGRARIGSGFDSSLEQVASDDAISLYMKEMSVVPLLTTEEEVDLAQRIERGYQARIEFVRQNGQLKPRRRAELKALIEDGNQARDYLIRANTRLVVSVARKYLGRGVQFLDLIQEGNLGLIRAVEKFEYRRGFRFSTYATWWIRQSITRSIADQARTIRVPVHMTDRLRQMYKVSEQMEQELGRIPTLDELAARLDLENSKVQWMLQVAQTPVSLDAPVGEDEDSELGINIEDEASPSPAQVTYDNMLRECMEEVLATLSPREARILSLRFGLGYDRPYTLDEVGKKFGLTRERIRQIEGMALRRLRQPWRSRLLREYV
jgi:RNA polymerase primary sigma factor